MPTPEASTLQGRIVRSHGGKLRLRDNDSLLSLDVALEDAGFEEGDVVTITILRRGEPLPPLKLPDQYGRPYGTPGRGRYPWEPRTPPQRTEAEMPEGADTALSG